ncbi:MAG: MraY family glycosyltransferase [Anaerolineaceae bacterium]|nr:MraY family glycosyltransferase [Anaerolineaceae bacterium]
MVIGAYLLVFAAALSVSLFAARGSAWLGDYFGITAQRGGRRQSASDRRGVSKLGGLSIFLGFVVAALLAQLLPIPRHDPLEIIRFIGLLLGAIFIFAVGIIDDLMDLSPLTLYVAQLIAAGIAILFLIFIEFVNNPFTGNQTDAFPWWVTVVVSLFWLGTMMNTVNFLDGLDGLAAGVALIASILLFANSAFVLYPPQTSVSLLPLALMGACAGFLLYNFQPARVIMGGSAYLLGYLLGTLSIIGGAKMATILLVMGLPLMDLAWQAVNRVTQGRNPLFGDRGHLHYRLLDSGWFSERQIVLAYYAFAAIFGSLTLFIESRFYKFIALSLMAALIALGFWLVVRLGEKKARTEMADSSDESVAR